MHGIGAAVSAPASLALIPQVFSTTPNGPRQWASTPQSESVASPEAWCSAAYLTQLAGWRSVFVGLAALAVPVLAAALVLLPRTGRVKVRTWTCAVGCWFPSASSPSSSVSARQGLAFTAMTAASLTGVDPAHHGVAGAVNITAQQVGSGLGVAVVTAIAAEGPGAAGEIAGYHAGIATPPARA